MPPIKFRFMCTKYDAVQLNSFIATMMMLKFGGKTTVAAEIVSDRMHLA